MATKAYRRFEQRIQDYEGDLELCDLLVQKFISSSNSGDTIPIAQGRTDEQYPRLATRENKKRSRNICGAHLKNTLYSSFIKDLYEDFSEYISTIMSQAAAKGITPADRFTDGIKDLKVNINDVLSSGDWDSAVRVISDTVFRGLERLRNTRKLIEQASTRLGFSIETSILDDAMPYLDARHIFVHRDGKTDDKYRSDYPLIALNSEKIVNDFAFASSARTAVIALAKEIDEKVIAANLIRSQDLAGRTRT